MNSNVELGLSLGPNYAKATTSGMRTFLSNFIHGFRTHLPLYLIAAITFTLGLIISHKTGVGFKLSGGKKVMFYMFYLAVLYFSVVSAWRSYLFWKSGDEGSLIEATLDTFNELFVTNIRATNSLHVLISFTFVMGGFTALKAAIPYIHPFSYDPDLHLLDKALHFGRSPHEWLSGFLDYPLVVFIINFTYNLWYFIMVFCLISAGWSKANPVLRMQFLATYFLIWILLGFVVAIIFSSAGPCYFEPLGFGSDYVSLMTRLEEIDANHYPVWALSVQEMLWDGYMGAPEKAWGISAFPSLHVAGTTMLALAAWQINRRLGWTAVAYVVLISIGSVLLGWHYAVDGYVSIILTILIWKTVGKILQRVNLKLTEVEIARPVQG